MPSSMDKAILEVSSSLCSTSLTSGAFFGSLAVYGNARGATESIVCGILKNDVLLLVGGPGMHC